MQNKMTFRVRLLILCGALLCLFLSGCSPKQASQEEEVTISMEDLAAANDLETLCTKYGAVSYRLNNLSEENGFTSESAYWLQDGDLVCSITSNLEGDADIYYTPRAEFYNWNGTTQVSCPVPGAGISTPPVPPYPNGFLSNPDADETLEHCKKTEDGYEFTITYHYDETSSTQCTYTTDRDYVITGCHSISKGENYQETSALSVEFSQQPFQPPAFAEADPVTLHLVSLNGDTRHTTEIKIPRNCLVSVYGTESHLVAWDEFGAKPFQDEIAATDNLTLYVLERTPPPAG